jgi:hypothetical protein
MIMTSIAIPLVVFLTITPVQVGVADTPQTAPVTIDEWDANLTEILLAQAESEGSTYNLSAAYEELKNLAKQYKKAKERGEQERIHMNAEEIMEQIFDAKVQHEQRRLQQMERRIRAEKERLNEMQAHKHDLINQGVKKALEDGEMPDWAKNSGK